MALVSSTREPVATRPPPTAVPLPTALPRTPNADSDREQRLKLRTRLFAVDLLAASIAWLIVSLGHAEATGIGSRLASAGAAAIATVVVLILAGRYRAGVCELWPSLGLATVWACTVGTVAFVVVRRGIGAGGGLTAATIGAVACFLLLGASRWQFDRWLRHARATGRFVRKVVLVGANADAHDLLTMVDSEPELGYSVEWVVGKRVDRGSWDHVPTAEGIDRVPDLARRSGASAVIVVTSDLSSHEVHRVLRSATAAGLGTQLWPGLKGIDSRRLRSVPISREALFYVERPASLRWHRLVKRAIDLALSSIVLVLSAPLLIVAGVLIKLHDRGPVLLRQQRVGRDGAHFTVFKLRTMVPDAEGMLAELSVLNERTDGPLFKLRTDPRVTPVGRVLRASSIDELPQLLNVLAGTMSLVGPRPALVDEVAQFDAESLRRLNVLPGVTGLWQVEARDNPSFNAYRRLDLLYVDNWSIGLDISILVRTGPVVIEHGVRALANALRRSGRVDEAR